MPIIHPQRETRRPGAKISHLPDTPIQVPHMLASIRWKNIGLVFTRLGTSQAGNL